MLHISNDNKRVLTYILHIYIINFYFNEIFILTFRIFNLDTLSEYYKCFKTTIQIYTL